MDFTFEDQQLAFRDAIRKFLMVEAAPEMLREIWETETGRSGELRAKLADQGLTALSVPEEFGGINLGDLDWVLVQQELGYFAIPDSLAATAYLAVYLLKHLPADVALKREWLPKIAAGNARVAVGHPINPLVADARGVIALDARIRIDPAVTGRGDARFAIRKTVAKEGQVGGEALVWVHRMVGRGVERVVDWDATLGAEAFVSVNDGRPAAIGQDHVERG